MAIIKILTAIFFLVLQANSQNPIPTQANYNQQYNTDRIFFADDPRVTQLYRDTGRTELDSYLQGVYGNVNNRPTTNQLGTQNTRRPTSVVIEPSIDLSPPPFAANNENYYATGQVGLSTRHSVNKAVSTTSVPIIEDLVPNKPVLRVDNVSRAIINFGINLMKTISSSQSGNTVASPYSVANLLAVLQRGANGDTQNQITNALQMTPTQSVETYSRLTNDIKKRSSSTILKTANNIFVADAFEINRAFKNNAIQNFGSDVTPTDFVKASRAVQDINSWVAAKTNNKITNVLSSNQVSEATQMVLVNTVFFKGQWELRFRAEATGPQEFKLNNGGSKMKQFMRAQRHYRLGFDPNNQAQVLVLPFESDYSLVVILPSEQSNVDTVLSTLTDTQLIKYQQFPMRETKVELPKFTVRADTNLNPILKQMGITNIFNQQADLKNIGTFRSHSPHISAAVHSAMMSIDEEGGTAAASTAFAAVALSYEHPTLMRVNRPFLAIIWDQTLSLPLFIAKIEDPIF